MTLKGGTTQACAACKYQRKRCTPECPLAPHFRPEQTEIFKNTHKLFGVKNILKVLDQIDPAQRSEAMRSMIYQANMRDRFPVHGCFGIVCQLHHQIRQAEKELFAVLSQLDFYKHQRRQHEIALSPDHSPESQPLQLGIPGSSTGGGGGQPHQFVPAEVNPGNFVWGQQTYCNENNDDGGKGLQELTIQDEVTHDYDEIYPFFDTIDDTQSYMDSKDANDSSSDSSPKETNRHNKLIKSADLQVNNYCPLKLRLLHRTELGGTGCAF